MDNPATIKDVEADWGPIGDDVMRSRVEAWVGRAWRKVKRVPSLVERLDAEAELHPAPEDQDLRLRAVDVIVAMVVRVLKNPRGLRQFSVDDGSATMDWSLSTGEIYLSDEELRELSPDNVQMPTSYSIPLGVPYWGS